MAHSGVPSSVESKNHLQSQFCSLSPLQKDPCLPKPPPMPSQAPKPPHDCLPAITSLPAVHANLCVLTTQSDRDVMSELPQVVIKPRGPKPEPNQPQNTRVMTGQCITQKDIDSTDYDEKQITGKVLNNQYLSIKAMQGEESVRKRGWVTYGKYKLKRVKHTEKPSFLRCFSR
ncbi:hypothetical protein VP01_1037g1 [Puccinia sorghi]|uniref:Uncharacterized protein n=1 Tax=Puccinia sorghi TaxID=27349 RepID=A0A0L6VVW7_9BASI|nr:hypothetical protein VP01_1037g1 [Puccinia sorghi]